MSNVYKFRVVYVYEGIIEGDSEYEAEINFLNNIHDYYLEEESSNWEQVEECAECGHIINDEGVKCYLDECDNPCGEGE